MLEVLDQMPVDNEPKPAMPGQESKSALDLVIESEVTPPPISGGHTPACQRWSRPCLSEVITPLPISGGHAPTYQLWSRPCLSAVVTPLPVSSGHAPACQQWSRPCLSAVVTSLC